MNPSILQLYNIAQKKERTIIGLMSGTSVDGLDIAVCKIKGFGTNTKIDVLKFETVIYDIEYRKKIASIFSKKKVDLQKLVLINEWIGIEHGKMILETLKKWKRNVNEIDAIASHGQTIYHAPKFLHPKSKFENGTLQLGDGDHIAVTTGIITISDFRQKHIAAGGEGAPLAAYGDYLIFSNKNENRIMLNIGGIANFTFLPANSKNIISTDTGPGNTIIDAFCKKYFKTNYDADGEFALKGNTNKKLLKELLNNSFFKSEFPKTIGPELFNLSYLENAQLISNTTKINKFDIIKTLTEFTAYTIATAISKITNSINNFVIYSSGGGIHNKVLMQLIKSHLPNIIFKDIKSLNINPDAKEAVLFALLANETLCGNSFENTSFNKAMPNIKMGKISFPN